MKTRQTLLLYSVLIGGFLFLVYSLTVDKVIPGAVEVESHAPSLELIERQSRIGLRHPNSFESPKERRYISIHNLSRCKLWICFEKDSYCYAQLNTICLPCMLCISIIMCPQRSARAQQGGINVLSKHNIRIIVCLEISNSSDRYLPRAEIFNQALSLSLSYLSWVDVSCDMLCAVSACKQHLK